MDTSPKIICSANEMSSRKVNFSFGHQDLTSQQNPTKSLLETVKRMGRIVSWKLGSNSNHTFGTILFEQPEHAALLLKQSGILFDGAIVRFWEDVHVLQLNDYCLQKVFSLLEIKDLFSVAQVNERFRENAQIVFPLEHKPFELSFGEDDNNEPWNHDIHQLGIFVEIFGAFIDSLLIDSDQLKLFGFKNIADLLLRYSSDSIKDMNFYSCKCDDTLLLEQFFPGLLRLHIYNLKNLSGALFDLLKGCHELKSLDFQNIIGNYESLQFNLPKLETIVFQECEGLEPHQMEKFFECNPQLKEVMIQDCGNVGENIYSMIGKHLPRIEKIGIYCSNCTVQPSLNQNAFASLKKLRFKGSLNSCVAVLRQLSVAKAPLTFLHLWSPTNDELIDAICDMKALNTLYLDGDDDDDDGVLPISSCLRICNSLEELTDLFVVACENLDLNGLMQIVQTAKKLRKLHLYYHAFEIDEDAYNSLVGILKKRAVKIPLKIYINIEQSDLPPHRTLQKLLTFHESDDTDRLQFSAFRELE